MWMYTAGLVALILLGVWVLVAMVRTGRPIRKLLRSGGMGLGALLGVHLLSAFTGVATGFGWFTVGAATLFGVPGVATLLLLDGILK